MVDERVFRNIFRVGEEIASGGGRSKLRIHEIASSWFSVIPIYGRLQKPIRMYYDQLSAVADGFEEIDPKRIQPTLNPVLTSRGLSPEYTTENYLYGFARNLRERQTHSWASSPEEIDPSLTLVEGAKKTIVVNAYERNVQARTLCIAHHGVVCCVCAFDFERAYGALGKGFIHVHHVVPLASIGAEYEVDPIDDLRPVCPNCHAMLHRTNPAMSITDLKALQD